MQFTKSPAILAILACLVATLVARPIPASANPPPKDLPLAGETFLIENRTAFVILPPEELRKKPQPWVLYAPTLPGLPGKAELWMFDRFTKAGVAIAGIDVGESYGNPKGRALYSGLHEELGVRRGFSTKPVLLARSRGGLMTLCWAAEHADKVGGFAGVYPVCNIASYPGVSKAAGAYQMSPEELTSRLAEHNPIDRLGDLAKAKIPFFAIHGDVDILVPLATNSGEVQKRYEALGGTFELVIPKGQGHNMWPGFFECEELVQFVLKHAK
jgi:pimeloyl-ACP methyl ester carboxylesterase